MTSPAEGAPQSVEVVFSPAQLSGLTFLEPGATVEVTNPGYNVPETAPTPGGDDSLTILVGGYEGRTEAGGPFPYRQNTNTHATRIIDVTHLDIVVEEEGRVPVKPSFVALSYDVGDSGEPVPELRPLLPDSEYDILDPETALPVASYLVTAEGTLVVTRTAELIGDADVRLVGASNDSNDYRHRPAVTPVSAAGFMTRTTAGVCTSPFTRESDTHLQVEPGSWRAPAGDEFGAPSVKVTIGSTLLIPDGAAGVHELRTARTLAARQTELDNGGPVTVDKYTTIGKDEPGSAQRA